MKMLYLNLAFAFAMAFSGCCHCQDKSGRWEYVPSSNTLAFYAVSGRQLGVIKMIKNSKFCRPTNEGKSYEHAPVILPPKTSAPTELEYNEAGWYANEIVPPSPPEGKVVSSVTYVVEDDSVVARYEYEDIQYGIEEFDAAMEEHLLHEREARGYTTREPDSYLRSNNIRWRQDAEDWVAHRDAVMEYALQLINEVQSGLRSPPTMEEFKAGLPKIEWSIE